MIVPMRLRRRLPGSRSAVRRRTATGPRPRRPVGLWQKAALTPCGGADYASGMRTLVAAAAALALLAPRPGRPHDEQPSGVPIAHLRGGGPAARDCLAGLEVTGLQAKPRARAVTCRDGDAQCDRDRLVNGRCEFWVRTCVAGAGACPAGAAAAVTVDAGGDRELDILGRTLEHLALPAAGDEACGALTTVTVPLGRRAGGGARKARTLVRWSARTAEGTTDDDAAALVCAPPAREGKRTAVSFPRIQERVFERSCTFSGCHGADAPQAGLVLTGDGVWAQLVDRPATTSAAKFAGKKLVVPGAPETSFLIDKLRGALGPGEGAPMPLGRAALPPELVEAVRKWILAGAPRTGEVGGGLSGERDEQPRIRPPAVPDGGQQAHMAPFAMGDRPETEGCQLVRLENAEPMFAGGFELFMHEGSHHFILRAWRCADPDGDGVTDCDDPGFDARFPTGFRPCDEFGHGWAFIVGSQTPHFLVDYQTPTTGVAVPLHRRQPLLLNSHYTNPYRDTLAEVWVNVRPADAALVRHPAQILFEVVANAFIKVPPGGRNAAARAVTCAFAADPLCDASGEPAPAASHFALLGMTSHMHKRATKFVADLSGADGVRIPRPDDMTDADDGRAHLYVSRQYSDPVNVAWWPPIVVERGQRLEYSCVHDNGVTLPVRLGCEETPGVVPGRSIVDQVIGGGDTFGGAARWCRADADCAGAGTGRCVPANLVFGNLAEDEMCILPGLYYPCAGGPETCQD